MNSPVHHRTIGERCYAVLLGLYPLHLYYTDMNLVIGATSIGPGPNGAVRRIRFDKCGEPAQRRVFANR